VVGPARVERPYYLCSRCHQGQFPADVELDIVDTESSPGVRRMQALVGQEAPFDHGREQMQVLAGLEVTTKAVERTAEAIGGDIAAREQQEIQRAVQLDLPIVVGEPIRVLYVQMDGTGVPVVKKETEGRKGNRRTPAKPSWDVFSPKLPGTRKAAPFAIRSPPLTPGPSKPPRSLGNGFTWRLGSAAGVAPKRKLSWATEPNGFGIWRISIFPVRSRSSIFITPANTSGSGSQTISE